MENNILGEKLVDILKMAPVRIFDQGIKYSDVCHPIHDEYVEDSGKISLHRMGIISPPFQMTCCNKSCFDLLLAPIKRRSELYWKPLSAIVQEIKKLHLGFSFTDILL